MSKFFKKEHDLEWQGINENEKEMDNRYLSKGRSEPAGEST